jgi:hypothetical protein
MEKTFIPMSIEEVKDAFKQPGITNELAKEMGQCSFCVRELRAGNKHFPRHNASVLCESGGKNHCTCKICW